MACPICSKEGRVLYEDNEVMALLLNRGVKEGHIAIAPKQHHQIISQIDDDVVAGMFSLAHKLTDVYPALQSSAFNLLANNRADEGFHFAINLFPRTEGDGLDLQWQQRQLSEEQMDQIAGAFKELPVSVEKKKPKQQVIVQETKEIDAEEAEQDYRVKSLDRMP